MDILKSAFGCYKPIFNLAELNLIKGYKAEDKIKLDGKLPIAQMVANAIEWHKGVVVSSGDVRYPTYKYECAGIANNCFAEAGEICPSPTAKLVGRCVEVAYNGDLTVEETLYKVFKTIEKFEEIHFDVTGAEWALFPFPPVRLIAYLWNEVGVNKKITPLLMKEEDFRRLNR